MQEDAKKTDRRVKYTKMVLKNSLVKILRGKTITKITVREICADADVNRATFYAHYKDQYDLLRQIENEVIENITRYLETYEFKDVKRVPVEMIERILAYIEENADLFDLLLNRNADGLFQREVIKIIGEQHFIPLIVQGAPTKEDAEYIYHFLASGAVSIIQKWLLEGVKRPALEIAGLIFKSVANDFTIKN